MTAEQSMIRLYRQAAKRLRAQIRDDLASGRIGTAAYRSRQLAQIRIDLQALGQRTPGLSAAVTRDAYARGLDLADAGIRHARDLGAGRGAGIKFHGSHRSVVAVLGDNMATRVDQAIQLVGRRVDDVYRRVALEQIGIGAAEGATRREVSAGIQRALLKENVTDALTGFVDKRGARWQLERYTEMVARTGTREAMSAATKNRLLEAGQDLVTISDHNTQTEICQEYEGKTFSLTGATPDYDVLDQEPPFHPNCQHVLTAGTGDLDADLALLEAELGAAAG